MKTKDNKYTIEVNGQKVVAIDENGKRWLATGTFYLTDGSIVEADKGLLISVEEGLTDKEISLKQLSRFRKN